MATLLGLVAQSRFFAMEWCNTKPLLSSVACVLPPTMFNTTLIIDILHTPLADFPIGLAPRLLRAGFLFHRVEDLIQICGFLYRGVVPFEHVMADKI